MELSENGEKGPIQRNLSTTPNFRTGLQTGINIVVQISLLCFMILEMYGYRIGFFI